MIAAKQDNEPEAKKWYQKAVEKLTADNDQRVDLAKLWEEAKEMIAS